MNVFEVWSSGAPVKGVYEVDFGAVSLATTVKRSQER